MAEERSRRERVLVVGDDMRIFLAVVRSLGRAGKEVHAAPFNWRSPALRSKYIARVHLLPRYSDDPGAWLEAILDLIRKHDFNLVLPCCDRAILPLDHHSDELKDQIVALTRANRPDALFDKEQTRQLAAELGIPVAPGETLRPEQTGQDLINRYGLPVVLKPRRSYSMQSLESWGRVHIVTTCEELDEVIAGIPKPSEYLVEGYFDRGEGVGVSVLSNEGRLVQAFQHRRLREGWGGSSSYRASEALDPELLSACQTFAGRVNLHGVCMFEFRRHPEHKGWILLETNARLWGSCALPISLGVDFPLFLYDLLVHGRVHPEVTYPAGVRSRNLLLDGANLVSSLRKPRGRGKVRRAADLLDYSLQPVHWLTGRERSDSFVSDDLRPGFAEIVDVAARAVTRSRRTRNGSERRGARAALRFGQT